MFSIYFIIFNIFTKSIFILKKKKKKKKSFVIFIKLIRQFNIDFFFLFFFSVTLESLLNKELASASSFKNFYFSHLVYLAFLFQCRRRSMRIFIETANAAHSLRVYWPMQLQTPLNKKQSALEKPQFLRQKIKGGFFFLLFKILTFFFR